jgi:hypothetical protein
VDSFTVQKKGNAPGENEDACYPSAGREINTTALRAAISDGSTEGALSDQWSRTLVRTFCRARNASPIRILRRSQEFWDAFLMEYLDERAKTNPVRWYEEPGLQQGAYASLLGLQIEGAPTGSHRKPWHAFAIGDSCLFQVRRNQLIVQFPIGHSTDFGSHPILVPSRRSLLSTAVDRGLRHESGYWRQGDTFYLATDALSAWFLAEVERNRQPWHTLRDLGTQDEASEFADWVHELRRGGQMKNDDVTLLRVDMY